MQIDDLEGLKCGCGCELFMQLFMMKKVPAVMSQSGKEQVAPIPIQFVCANCGKNVQDLTEPEKEESKIIL